MRRVDTCERVGVSLHWAARSETGHVRSHNEDSLVALPGVFAVADGMGGHEAGDVASRLVAEQLSALAARLPLSFDAVDELIGVANATVRREARELASDLMGTTLVAALLVENAGTESMVVVNVGDSRCYLHDESGMRAMTHDHSLVQEHVDAGRISAVDARHHPDRHVVTRAVGVEEHVVPDFVVLEPVGTQRLLLCSDGVSSQVDEEFLASVLAGDLGPERAVDEIVERVLAGRAPDNATAIVVDIEWAETGSDDDSDVTGPRPSARPAIIERVPGAPS